MNTFTSEEFGSSAWQYVVKLGDTYVQDWRPVARRDIDTVTTAPNFHTAKRLDLAEARECANRLRGVNIDATLLRDFSL